MRIVDGVWVDGFDVGEKNRVFPRHDSFRILLTFHPFDSIIRVKN